MTGHFLMTILEYNFRKQHGSLYEEDEEDDRYGRKKNWEPPGSKSSAADKENMFRAKSPGKIINHIFSFKRYFV